MKNFSFTFDGTKNSDGSMNAGIKHLSGEPVDIAHCLGAFASEALKKKSEPQAAIIVMNAFKKFMELNPQMTEQMAKMLMADQTDDSGYYKKIIPAGMRIIKPNGNK